MWSERRSAVRRAHWLGEIDRKRANAVHMAVERGSNTATMATMAIVPQKELRNNVGEVLRRAEAGEEITITVSGRPVASLGPVRTRQWVRGSELADLRALPPDPTLARDIEDFGAELRDPWAAE